MIDGLEISEIKFSDLKVDNEKNRLDSEFYLKKYINAYSLVKAKKNSRIVDLYSTFTDFHSNGSYKVIAQHFKLLDERDYAYMVRTTDLEKENYIDSVKYVTKSTYEFLSKSKVFGGELLINKIGSPGRTFLMPKLNIPVSLGMNLFLLRIKNNENISEELIYLFFNSEIGKNIIERKINGTVPLTIDKEAIKSLYVPLFSKDFLNIVKSLIAEKNDCSKNAQGLYLESEKILEENLCIKQSSNEPVSIKTLSESFSVSGRLDAEYYQPKYDELFNVLKKHNTKQLGGKNGLVNIKKSIEPGSKSYKDEGIPFVRVSDIDKFEITSPEIKLPQDIVPNIENLYPKKDTILLSKDGSVGIAHKIQEDLDVVTSGALLHLTVKNINEVLPDYLTLVLNSPIVQLQAERDCNGAIIQHWKPADIEKVVIPILDMEKQIEIADKVQESFRLRKKSKELLDIAVKAVEMAIETDEETAIAWMKEQGV